MRHISKFLAVLGLSIAFAPATAFAQSDTSRDAYENSGPQVQERIDQSNPAPDDENGGGPTPVAQAAEEQGGGELPFTGLDVALVIGAGALLLGLGVGMRRLTRPAREPA